MLSLLILELEEMSHPCLSVSALLRTASSDMVAQHPAKHPHTCKAGSTSSCGLALGIPQSSSPSICRGAVTSLNTSSSLSPGYPGQPSTSPASSAIATGSFASSDAGKAACEVCVRLAGSLGWEVAVAPGREGEVLRFLLGRPFEDGKGAADIPVWLFTGVVVEPALQLRVKMPI